MNACAVYHNHLDVRNVIYLYIYFVRLSFRSKIHYNIYLYINFVGLLWAKHVLLSYIVVTNTPIHI